MRGWHERSDPRGKKSGIDTWHGGILAVVRHVFFCYMRQVLIGAREPFWQEVVLFRGLPRDIVEGPLLERGQWRICREERILLRGCRPAEGRGFLLPFFRELQRGEEELQRKIERERGDGEGKEEKRKLGGVLAKISGEKGTWGGKRDRKACW